MKSSPGLTLVLGMWLGATAVVLPVIIYNFYGIEMSVQQNDKLQEKLGIPRADLSDREARRQTVLWLYASELNRAQFYAWNRAQLILAAVALLVALLRCPRSGVILCLTGVGLIILALTFYVAPQATLLGRQLDLVATGLPDKAADFEKFRRLHKSSEWLEGAKTLLLVLASFLAIRAGKGERDS